jgi:hypothetical protein
MAKVAAAADQEADLLIHFQAALMDQAELAIHHQHLHPKETMEALQHLMLIMALLAAGVQVLLALVHLEQTPAGRGVMALLHQFQDHP